MKVPFFILLLFLCNFASGQAVTAPAEYSQDQLLSLDAYQIFKTNKFLDFKEKDSLIQIIDTKIYAKTDLNNYFSYKKNWKEIENETVENYKQEGENYIYNFVNGNMIESKPSYGTSGVIHKVETIYNAKGFVLKREEKIFVGDNFVENRIIINEFDAKNRVTKITNKTEKSKIEENTESSITAVYKNNLMEISSKNGTVICKFIADKNAIGFISKLSPRETAKYFFYALKDKDFELAKEYCTVKMFEKIQTYSIFNNQIQEVKWLRGSDHFSQSGVKVEDAWEIKFATGEKEKFNVNFVVIKQDNGWKIDDFKIDPAK